MNDSAFPHEGLDNGPGNIRGRPETGLTKRELFAAMALQGILSGPCSREGASSREWFDIPDYAVKLADKLLSALSEQQP